MFCYSYSLSINIKQYRFNWNLWTFTVTEALFKLWISSPESRLYMILVKKVPQQGTVIVTVPNFSNGFKFSFSVL